MPKFRAAMFDLDGTLLDTIDDLADSMNSVLVREGLPIEPVEKHKFMVGDGVRNYVLRALPAARREDSALIERVTRQYKAAYAGRWHRKTRPYDGIEAMLEALSQRGVKLSVLSNKPDDFSRQMVGHFLGRFPFEVVRGALENGPLKPDPAAALAIAREMKVDRADFVYVGDTATDMKTAVAAGMFAVGAMWGFRSREELEQAGAKELIAHPVDLLRLV